MPRRIFAWAGAVAIAVATVNVLVNPAAANTAHAAPPWCTADSLSLRVGGDPDRNYLIVILTNISAQSCTMQGYPGVDLVGPDDPVFGPTYSLPRQAGDPQPFRLDPWADAISYLTFLPGPPDGWVPSTVVVTPPDATTQLKSPWNVAGVSVLRQDAATHPGTYIGPLQLAYWSVQTVFPS
jgi:hypothetical protein